MKNSFSLHTKLLLKYNWAFFGVAKEASADFILRVYFSAFMVFRPLSTVINQWNIMARERGALRDSFDSEDDKGFKMSRMERAAPPSYSSQFMSFGSSYEK